MDDLHLVSTPNSRNRNRRGEVLRTKRCPMCGRRRSIKYFVHKSTIRRRCDTCRTCLSMDTYLSNIHKHRANIAVKKAIKAGLIVPEPCVICAKHPPRNSYEQWAQSRGKAVAHHNDYSKPLDVIWLCRRHHRHWHVWFMAEGGERLESEVDAQRKGGK